MKALLSTFSILSLLLAGLVIADPGDLTPEEAMEKLKARQEARRLAIASTTQSAITSELTTVRAVNAELKTENASLKATIERLKAEIMSKDKQLAEASMKTKDTASTTLRPGDNIFDVNK